MDELNKIAFNLEKTLHLINRKRTQLLKENNSPISKDQWIILERVADQEGSNQKNIAKDTLKDPAALTRMLDILVAKGYVRRKTSSLDRRTFDIFTTVEGNRLVNRITPKLESLNSVLQLNLEDEQYSSFQKFIDQLNSKLDL